jgi:hypothetical protein
MSQRGNIECTEADRIDHAIRIDQAVARGARGDHVRRAPRTSRIAAALGAALVCLHARIEAAPQNVQLQSTSPGTAQTGHLNLTGTGLFGSALAVGTSSPVAAMHVHADGGSLALEGDTHSYTSFYPQGVANGRKGYFGFSSAGTSTISLVNETAFGNIFLGTTPSGGVGINSTPSILYGLRVYTGQPNGYGVFSDNGSTTGSAYGLFGRTNSTLGFGVYGVAISTTGAGTGVLGRSDSIGGRGVYGTVGQTSGTTYAVFGYCGSPSGYALYGQGRLATTGTKSFVIDHPFDPERMTLTHYCTEGAEPLNVYSGKVELDASGRASVSLPDYFEEINTDPRYSLTPIGAAMPDLHVASEVLGNRFEIAGGVPGKKVSWRIEGVRNDRFVQRYGAPVEQVKGPEMRGKYLGPELYGQPIERGVQYVKED